MKRTKMIIYRILYPPVWFMLPLSVFSFGALIFIFAEEKTESVLAYFLYSLSAYSLVILCMASPRAFRWGRHRISQSKIFKKLTSVAIADKYIKDMTFRGTVSIYQGLAINIFYMIFRVVVGILYTSVWFISMAVYYLILGMIRAYLIICYRRDDVSRELICYRNTALFLFLLNIPMGGMIILMIRTNSGFSYPGYVIYLSALYTFYTFIMAIRNLVTFRKVGSPVLSAGKVLNFVSAMMSVLGLQTAMIAQFSTQGEDYRRMMNAITGGCVYAIVIIIAVYMLLHSRKQK